MRFSKGDMSALALAVAFSSDGKRVVSIGEDERVRIWDSDRPPRGERFLDRRHASARFGDRPSRGRFGGLDGWFRQVGSALEPGRGQRDRPIRASRRRERGRVSSRTTPFGALGGQRSLDPALGPERRQGSASIRDGISRPLPRRFAGRTSIARGRSRRRAGHARTRRSRKHPLGRTSKFCYVRRFFV